MDPATTAYVRAWFWAFVFTQAVEVPIYVAVLGLRRRVPRGRLLALAFGASALTHPILWFALIPAWDLLASRPAPTTWLAALVALTGPPSAERLALGGYVAMSAVAETFAVVTEAVYLALLAPRLGHPMTLPRALALSLLANAASVALGLLSRALFQFP